MGNFKRQRKTDRKRKKPANRWLTPAFHAAVFTMLFSYITSIQGQVPVFGIPEPKVPQHATFGSNYNNNPTAIPRIDPNNPLSQYEQDQKDIQKRTAALQRDLGKPVPVKQINYDLLSLSFQPGTEYYRNAAAKLNRMLRGAEPMSLKQAVFTCENAYFEGKLNYQDFNKRIQKLISIARLKAAQEGFDWNNPQTRNVMLFRVLADTLKVKDSSVEGGTATSYPMQYDFDDINGNKDWTKMFVSKLLLSKTGQCHSLPLLYLIMCEETNTKASLAFSPSHSYAKFKDKSGNWYNVELTNGRIVSDAFLLASGYITSEALKNHIYLEPQTKRQTIACFLNDLSNGYLEKYGYDNFMSQCADTTLKYAPSNISALIIKSNYQTRKLAYLVYQVGRPNPDVLKQRYPRIYKAFLDRNQTYQKIDDSGFQAMPVDAYNSWLKSMNAEKEKREQQGLMLRLTKTLN